MPQPFFARTSPPPLEAFDTPARPSAQRPKKERPSDESEAERLREKLRKLTEM